MGNGMERIWNFFENMNEYVYVADADTHELVYMNKKMRDTYGIHSKEELAGKKCYELLQNSSLPCTICNNDELQEGQFKEWRYFNPLLNKYFKIKDTVVEDNGRRYRIEIALNISSQEHQKNVVRRYEKLEKIVNEGLRLALGTSSADKSLDIILEYIGKALDGERTYIFEHNENGCDDNTYEWVANGIKPEKDNLQNLPTEVCANWYRNFQEDKNIVIENLENIREEDPEQYKNLKRQDIHSLVVVPLYWEKKIIGFYGVDNPPAESLDYVSNMLHIMGYFIVSSIRRRNLLRQLERMSYRDQLTQFGNRYAVDWFVEYEWNGEQIGVVYCDITGLKKVNDEQGHEAGDRLIIRACECLAGVFKGYGLYRIGGDEFLVLCLGIEEKDLREHVEKLRMDMKEHQVTMAVGMIWKERGPKDIDLLLNESERLMYEDKDRYYKEHGLKRRR